MAKVTDTQEAPVELESGIIDYTPETATNKYTDTVKALIEAGEGKAFRLVVPTSEVRGEGDKQHTVNVSQLEKLAFQAAANALDKTARVVGSKDGEVVGDKTAYTFILKAKYNKPKLGPRKSKGGAEQPLEVAPDAETAPDADALA